MKKKLLFSTIILILLAGILYTLAPDYLVFNSMSFSNGANRDTNYKLLYINTAILMK